VSGVAVTRGLKASGFLSFMPATAAIRSPSNSAKLEQSLQLHDRLQYLWIRKQSQYNFKHLLLLQLHTTKTFNELLLEL
jgi:hypothetical protein